MTARAYDRSIEEIERQRLEEQSRYGGGSIGYGEPAWGRQQQQLWNQPAGGGYTQPFQQQFNPFNPTAQTLPYGFPNPAFGAGPWSMQPGINPYAGIDPFRQSLQYGQPFPAIYGQQFGAHSATQLNPLLQTPFAGYPQAFGGSFPGIGQQGIGGFIDPMQLRQLQLWNLALGYGQPFQSNLPGLLNPLFLQSGIGNYPQTMPGFGTPYAGFPQVGQQSGLPFGQQFGQQYGAGMQSEVGRTFGLSRNVRRGPKAYKRPDELIRDDISEKLALHPYVDATNCEVIVKDGEVTVRGTVDDRLSKTILEEIAESVFGVKDVLIEVRVGQPPESLAGRERETEMVGATKGGREK